MQLKTPDVYVKERSIFPPSVAEVATAVPAFIGVTARTEMKEESIINVAKRITSMIEFAAVFGGADEEAFNIREDGIFVKEDNGKFAHGYTPTNILYQSVEHFFANGGGACYVVTVGTYADAAAATVNAASYKDALKTIAQIDEVTLLVLSDAKRLAEGNIATANNGYYSLCNDALTQCAETQDRFALIDVLDDGAADGTHSDYIQTMRDSTLTESKYGASYYPYLQTTMPRSYDEEKVMVTVYDRDANGKIIEDAAGVELFVDTPVTLASLKGKSAYASVKKALESNKVILPPASAMAGIYASVDGARGVWKAPANVGVASTLSPTRVIDNKQQEDMNVDVVGGKSVNAIRAFVGKGTLVWGARTLAGNDNEWRYISVRRFFNMVEESVKKASYFAVFEPNTPFTWLKLKTMISSYLENLRKQGALFGASPEQAYFVNVGLGQTMTADDINNGLLKIEIGLAAVRPAEFIVLTFSHKAIDG